MFAGVSNAYTYNQRLQPVTMSATAPSQTIYSISYDFHLVNGTTGADNGNVFGITNYKDANRYRSFTPMSSFDPLLILKLSTQRALIGEVTEHMLSVTCGLKEREIKINVYFSTEVRDKDIERVQSIGAEIIADFPDGYTIDESCLSANKVEEEMLDFWAFHRAAEN